MNDEEQQAFPDGLLNQDGMTLRDYFAAKAMQSFLEEVASGSSQHFYKDIAIGAYRVADAMLKAREA